jgi:FlaG/FlaF family flagellin (archaellin)
VNAVTTDASETAIPEFSKQPGVLAMHLHRYNRKGLETILAGLLLVVIVVVMSVTIYSWSLGIFGSSLPAPPNGKEILTLENQAFNNANNNMTLFLRNTGTATTTLVSYYISDLNGNQCSKATGWNAGPITPTQLGKAYIATPATNYCTWTGTPFTYQTGNSYTVTVVTSRNNQFAFTVLR